MAYKGHYAHVIVIYLLFFLSLSKNIILLNREKFKYLFDQYYNPLCNYVACNFNAEGEEEDIVMDVFTHMLSLNGTMDRIENPKSYLFKSVHNKALERLRAKKVQILPFEVEKYVVVDYKEENTDNFMLKEKIYQSVRQLPKQCQRIFVKAKFEGQSYKQIAEDLSLSIKTIENQMSKALKLIKQDVQK